MSEQRAVETFQASFPALPEAVDPFALPPSADETPAESGPPPEVSRDESGRFKAKPKHTTYWLRKAHEVGISADDSDQMDPAELREAVRAELHQQDLLARDTETVRRRTPDPEPEAEAEIPDFLDVPVKALFRKLIDDNKALRTELGGVKQGVEARASSAKEEVFDDAFAALGKAAQKLFGDGNAVDLRGTQELKRRGTLLRAAGIDPSQPLPPNATARSVARALKHAFDEMYGPLTKSAYEDDEPTQAHNRLTPEQQRWIDNGGVERPTSRTAPPREPGVAAAKDYFEREMKKTEANGAANGNQQHQW